MFTPKQINLSAINSGKKFKNGDVVTPDAINAPIEASAYAQEQANGAHAQSTYALQKVLELDGQVNGSGKNSPNSNILDNWYFINPINQLEVEEFSNAYGIDRWLGSSGILITNNGITFTTGSKQIVQRFEESTKAFLNGKTITVSVMTSDKKLFYASTIYKSSPDTQTTFLYSDIIHCAISTDGALVIWAVVPCTIIAAKMEIGATQTLGYQTSDTSWNLNDAPPNPALELMKCQRYMVVYKGYSFLGMGVCYNGLAQIAFPLPVTMRLNTVPVITDGAIGFYNGYTNYDAVGLDTGLASLNSATAKINVNLAEDIPNGTVGTLWLPDNRKFLLDANL